MPPLTFLESSVEVSAGVSGSGSSTGAAGLVVCLARVWMLRAWVGLLGSCMNKEMICHNMVSHWLIYSRSIYWLIWT